MMPLPQLTFGFEVVREAPKADLVGARQAVEKELRAIGTLIQTTWINVANARKVKRTGAYIRGIKEEGRVTMEFDGSDLTVSGTIEVTNTAPHARIVEDGHSAFHLPDRINWGGPKVKIGKDGKRFLHIPFGHRAYASPDKVAASGLSRATQRQMLPPSVYNRAKRLSPSRGLLRGPQYDGQGRYRAADLYKWGRRLHVSGSEGLKADPKTGELFEHQRSERTVNNVRLSDGSVERRTNPAWQAPKHEGLFRVPRLGGKGGGSRYMTIRTITQNSPGWNIPAQPGRHVASDVATFLRSPRGMESIRKAVSRAIVENLK